MGLGYLLKICWSIERAIDGLDFSVSFIAVSGPAEQNKKKLKINVFEWGIKKLEGYFKYKKKNL